MNYLSLIGTALIILWIYLLYLRVKKSEWDLFWQQKSITLPTFWVTLFMKLLSGVLLGFIYFTWYKTGDTLNYFADATLLGEWIKSGRLPLFDYLIHNRIPGSLLEQLHFTMLEPRALFFAKIVTCLSLISGNSYLLISLLISLFSYTGIFLAFDILIRKYPNTFPAALFSFFLLPGAAFWSSGIIKESIAVGSMGLIFYFTMKLVHKDNQLSVRTYLAGLLGLLLLWYTKYYFAAVFIPTLLSWILSKKFTPENAQNTLRLGIWFSVLVLFIAMASFLKVQLDMSYLPHIISDNYHAYVAKSAPGHFLELPYMESSWIGLLKSIPKALFGGLFLPWPIPKHGVLYFFQGLENIVLMILFLSALPGIWKGIKQVNLALISSLVYVFGLSTLLVMSSPNFGTLARYRVGWLLVFGFIVLYYSSIMKHFFKNFKIK